MLIGAVADDLTGATDLALMLTAGGMRTIQVMGVPADPPTLSSYDAVVVALKSRTIPAADAVEMSLASARALQAAGCRQLLFKYCSTFDSTDDGNIGPVSEALMELTGSDLTIACPAFPTNGRTIYMGNLFVGQLPLAESPMRDHPLTPMRDSNL
ncbi:MAG: four-carbon acid sugar kinase family protein, partial [Planctomycetes bacterium]|nr:four-carbon acid sugar kinase family protein [Planctomycetota bacterium]